MNFSYESVKDRSKPRNEDFCFEMEVQRGHLFVLLDFDNHEYANLNETFQRKMPTIVESFSSLDGMSAELFLGCVAKEVNNLVHDLGHKYGGGELLCTAALCLLTGNKLTYLTCGDVRINVFKGGQLVLLNGSNFEVPSVVGTTETEAERTNGQPERFGKTHLDTPLTNRAQSITVQDDDVVLLFTSGLEEALAPHQRVSQLTQLGATDPKAICEALIGASATTRNDRTLIVVGGPYKAPEEHGLKDLKQTISSLSAQVSTLSESDQRREAYIGLLQKDLNKEVQIESRVNKRIESVREELKGKAGKLNLLELEERLKKLEDEVVGKAETAELLTLQRDVVQLRTLTQEAAKQEDVEIQGTEDAGSLSLTEPASTVVESTETNEDPIEPRMFEPPMFEPPAFEPPPANEWAMSTPRSAWTYALNSLLVIVAAGVGIMIGTWLRPLLPGHRELWSVSTSGDQLQISRQEGQSSPISLSLKLAQPVGLVGEQKLASFADVKHHLDKLNAEQDDNLGVAASEEPPKIEVPPASPFQEVEIQPKDTIATIANRYNISQSELRRLNPRIRKWTLIQPGQKVTVPSSSSVTSTAADRNVSP